MQTAEAILNLLGSGTPVASELSVATSSIAMEIALAVKCLAFLI